MAHYRTIHHDKKFIAFFSPKCGCTTLKEWFIKSLELDDTAPSSDISHYMIPPCDVKEYPGYRKVFFIRNPFHRLVSFYCGFVVRETPLWCFADNDGQQRLEGRSFAEFVHMLQALSRQGLPFQHHLQPQLDGVEDVEFDRIVLMENFDTEIRLLNHELDIVYEPQRRNATRYSQVQREFVYDWTPNRIVECGIPPRQWFYNDELVDMVSCVYADDIKYYELHSTITAADSVV